MVNIYPTAHAFAARAINCGTINAIPLEKMKGEHVRFARGLRSGIWQRKER